MNKKIFSFCIIVIFIVLIHNVSIGETMSSFDTSFPTWAIGNGYEPEAKDEDLIIENEHVKIKFRKRIRDEKYFIQNQISVKDAGSFHVVKPFQDGYGYLMLYADSADAISSYENPSFKFTYNGTEYSAGERNKEDSYKAGYPVWLIPEEMRMSDDNKSIIISGSNEYVSYNITWSLSANDKEPKVNFKAEVKKEGNYSFGMFYTTASKSRDDIKFVQVPFRYQEMALPETPLMVTEAYSTSGISQATTKTGVTVDGKDFSYGVLVDPSSQQYRWVYNDVNIINNVKVHTEFEQANYGLTITTTDSNVNPGIFAPIMGSADSKMTANEEFSFYYRPINCISEASSDSWYDLYSDLLSRVLKITNYRENYFASLTDTIFNVQELLMNDDAAGWDEEGKAHYYTESRNIVTHYDPLIYLQAYLLTEDEEIYKKRTIPSIEFVLSRNMRAFAFSGPLDKGTEGTLNYAGYAEDSTSITDAYYKDKTEEEIKSLRKGYTGLGVEIGKTGAYPTSSYAGLSLMTLGRTGAFEKIVTESFKSSSISQPTPTTSKAIPNPSELLWRYKITDNTQYLEKAKENSDNYITYRIETPYDEFRSSSGFVNSSFYPNFYVMLEMYEETKEEKYLKAAESAAKQLIATMNSSPMPRDRIQTIDKEKTTQIALYDTSSINFYKGDRRIRLGADESFEGDRVIINGILKGHQGEKTESIPEWVTSRVGLGLEEPSTFRTSRNIYLSTWAPELMRLYSYTGNEMFYIYARNAIIGRYANYPGYYVRGFQTYSSMADYPYTGVDGTTIEYHHIPITLAYLQDFLFEQAFALSNQNITFPSTRLEGAAYFNIRHYGFDSGKVFDENDMWLWLKKGLVNVENMQIDWFAAKKDGRVAFVFMNESGSEVTTNVEFNTLFKIGSEKNAVLYQMQNGQYTKSNIVINDGKNSITVPAYGLISIAFDAEIENFEYAGEYEKISDEQNIGASSYKLIEDDYSKSIDDVFAYSIQVKNSSYEAYIYTPRRPNKVNYEYNGDSQIYDIDTQHGIQRIVVTYQIDGEEKKITDSMYPFEVSIPVSIENEFKYKIAFYRDNVMLAESAWKDLDGHEWSEWTSISNISHRRHCTREGCNSVKTEAHTLDENLVCTVCGQQIKKHPYNIDEENKVISKIKEKTTVEEFKKNINGKITKEGKELAEDDFVGTGCKITTENGKEYTLVVRGDVNGDGKIGTTDLLKIKRNIVGLEELDKVQTEAGDIDEKGGITITDVIYIKRVIVGLITL